MANLYITGGDAGGAVSVWRTKPDFKDTLTASAGTDITGVIPGGLILRLVSDGDGWVQIGPAPTAASGSDYFVSAGAEFHCGPTKEGDKVSFYSAS